MVVSGTERTIFVSEVEIAKVDRFILEKVCSHIRAQEVGCVITVTLLLSTALFRVFLFLE